MKTNANTRIRLEARFRLCGAFLQNFAWLDRLSSQRHITFIATEEVKLDGYRSIGVRTSRDTGQYSRNGKNFNKRYPLLRFCTTAACASVKPAR